MVSSITPMANPEFHPNDPLHGVTLKAILEALVERHGWKRMGEMIPIRCFMFDPTINSSLKFLRRTPWARKKVEDWYVYDLRQAQKRAGSPGDSAA